MSYKQAKRKVRNKITKVKKRKTEYQAEIDSLLSTYQNVNAFEIKTFKDIPLSSKTRKGLEACGYKIPTEIQREAIILALQKNDVLGAAKTGSGKTLAFLVPLIEVLYCKKWTSMDGLGALVITPTRELALQIFDTLRNLGRFHEFSAGLIIGGKDLKFERNRMDKMNIIICTPGRLLQHMDENPLFECSALQVLVLDEADRCLDLGFEKTMNAIIENLPKERLTLLFSATQTRKVKDLARLSLTDPKYVSVHEHEKHKTPDGLVQSYIVCDQHDKIALLWSFIKNHLKNKVIVFMATCNQVRFCYEMIKLLQPHTTLLSLHGKLHQLKRIDIFNSFCTKQSAVLFATDIAARGLDFPAVHWVVQLDCPEDVDTYIHRAGRTARYQKGGECLLVLRPSELSFAEKLKTARIPIENIKVNPAKLFTPQAKLEAFLCKNPSLKESAQRAFVSYAKSIFLMKDKSVFDVNSIDTEKFARSLGLVVCPRIRFLKKFEKNKKAVDNINSLNEDNDQSNEDEGESDLVKKGLSEEGNLRSYYGLLNDDGDDGDDILAIKRVDHQLEENDMEIEETEFHLPQIESQSNKKKKKKKISAIALAKQAIKKKIILNKKTVFDEDGEAVLEKMRERVTDAGTSYTEESGINVDRLKQIIKEEDKIDRKLFGEKIKERKREEKRKRKEKLGLMGKKRKNSEEISEEEEYSEPDLSWLPDPDKIYGTQEDSQTENKNEVSEDDESKASSASEEVPESSEEDFVSLRDKEELALQLLTRR